MIHCLATDRKCTCPCGKGLRPEFSELRDKRGRICADCQAAEEQAAAEKKYQWEQENCICSWNEFSGRSVCGLPCPVHKANDKSSGSH
jgi:hypothetical protein